MFFFLKKIPEKYKLKLYYKSVLGNSVKIWFHCVFRIAYCTKQRNIYLVFYFNVKIKLKNTNSYSIPTNSFLFIFLFFLIE
jgi:hypothetical protein